MRNKWIIAALVVSVTVNLLFLGFAVGRWSDAPAHMRGLMDPAPDYLRTLRVLPDERRREIRKLIRDQHKKSRDMHGRGAAVRNLRETQRAIRDALAAEPFDPDELAAALARFRTLMGEGQGQGHDILVAIAAELTAAERRMLLEHVHHRGGRHHQRSKGERDGSRRPDRE